MLRVLALGVSIAAGIALGLVATGMSLRGEPPFGAVHSGVWTAWPDTGTVASDPYARAIFAREGRIALPTAAGLSFFARVDSAGRPLAGRCTYAFSGPTPAAQYWTLAILDPRGAPLTGSDPREGFTSAELVRDENGAFAIVLARHARPGNWLPTRTDGPFVLMLTFYETPLGTALSTGGPVPALPPITRTECP